MILVIWSVKGICLDRQYSRSGNTEVKKILQNINFFLYSNISFFWSFDKFENLVLPNI